MTRKDFEAIAKIISGDISCAVTMPRALAIRGVALSMADYFYQSNPRFDRTRFYLASGLTADGMLDTNKMIWLLPKY